MTCTEARDLLPLLPCGDLPPAEADRLRAHLRDCPGCAREMALLERVRGALDAAPVPAVQVDLHQLYRDAMARQARRLRRWRRAAVVCAAAAAVLVAVVGLRLQVRVQANQVVLSWDNRPAPRVAPAPTPPPTEAKVPADVEERLRLMSNLIHALADDMESRDSHQQESLARIEERLNTLQAQGNRRWSETERTVAALAAAQLDTMQKGESP
jgi:hypothetical protein